MSDSMEEKLRENETVFVIDAVDDKKARRTGGRVGRFRSTKRVLTESIVTSLTSFPHCDLDLSLETIAVVTRQLGYLPVNIINVVSPPPGIEEPQVAILYPLNCKASVYDRTGSEFNDSEAKPFPTTFWITCPKLHARISKLEDKGWITRLQRRLLEEEGFEEHLEAMQLAHRRYAEFRMSLLSASHKQLIHEKGWTDKLSEVGVAGMKAFNCVKCLHCHYAHYAGRPYDGNVIGQWVQELLEQGADRDEEGKDKEEGGQVGKKEEENEGEREGEEVGIEEDLEEGEEEEEEGEGVEREVVDEADKEG